MRLLLVLVAVSCLGASAPRAGSAGVTVALPGGWDSIAHPAMRDAPVTDPVTRVVVASGRLRSVHTGCQVASYSFPRRAVAIVILEWHGTYGGTRFAPRPSRFTARNLPLLPAPAIECFNGRGGSIQFTDGGRRFGAYLLLGIDAPRPLAAKARAVLDTLRVRART